MLKSLHLNRAKDVGFSCLKRWIATSSWVGSTLEKPTHHGATIVLASGGIESTALLTYWTHWSHSSELMPLFIHYGQQNALKEERAALDVCKHLDLELDVLNVGTLGEQFREMQRGEKRHSRVAFRNLMLLSLAANVAAEAGAHHVAIALSKDHSEKTGADNSIAFIRHAEALLHVLDPPISLLTPLINLSTQQIVQMGQRTNAPWGKTWSCVKSGEEHCGECGPCIERKKALIGLL